MLTGFPEVIVFRHHMVTGVQEVIPYCPLEHRQENK